MRQIASINVNEGASAILGHEPMTESAYTTLKNYVSLLPILEIGIMSGGRARTGDEASFV